MTDLREQPKSADRRPTEVPHHPKVLTVAAIVAGAALLFMGAWFWQVMTSPGIILTAEQQSQLVEEEAAAEELASDRDRAEEAAGQPAAGNSDGRGGGPPEAPDANDPVTTALELTEYSILSQNGILQVGGTLTNTSASPLSGTVKVYVYTDRVPVATAKTEIENLQPGASEEVNMVSDSEWEPGEKVILLDFQSATTKSD